DRSKVIFLHRQPFYLYRFEYSWQLHSFNTDKSPIDIDQSGISLDKTILIYHKDKLIVLQSHSSMEVRTRGSNVILVSGP
ncbi:hypothetical protein PFISCL1PPCAC_10836, partial [Pristionchus fissidentatus]